MPDPTPYATAAELQTRYDRRDLQQLASDDLTPVDEADLTENPKIVAALIDASADIDAALLTGGRYTLNQLENLTEKSLWLLQRITCEIALVYLMERRPVMDPERFETYEKIRQRHLERMRKGENVFALPGHITAGAPVLDGPSTLNYDNMRLVRDACEGKAYPRRRIPNY